MHKRNCFTSVICAAVFACFYAMCGDLMDSGAYWPALICKTGLALSVLQFAVSAFCWARSGVPQGAVFPLSAPQCLRSAAVLAIMAVWISCLRRIGFLTSSAAALCAVSLLFEPERTAGRFARDVAVCVVFAALCYCAFKYLGINFPKAALI